MTSPGDADVAAPTGRKVHPVLSGAIARLASFVPVAIATFATSHLVIAEFGIPAFNGYALALSLMFLIPLNDLGVGTAVAAAFASHDPGDEERDRVVLTASRVVAGSSVAVVVVSLAISAIGWWDDILGPASFAGRLFGVSMAVYALSFVPALGQSMLLGVHKNHVTVLVQTLFTPIMFVGVLLLVVLDVDGRWLVVVPAVSLVAVNVLTSAVAARMAAFSWATMLRRLPSPARHPGTRIRGIAGPRLIISITVPLALASDRVILSQFSTGEAVASYSIAMQIFGPVLALIGAAAQPLWPIFVAAKRGRADAPNLPKVVALFVLAAAALAAVLVVVAGPIGSAVSADEVDLGLLLPVAGGLVVVVTAVTFPMSAALTTPAELRFAAGLAVVALPVNLGTSAVLASHIGAPGPLLATAGVGLFVQALPAALYLRRHAADAGEHADELEGVPASEGQESEQPRAKTVVTTLRRRTDTTGGPTN